MAWFPKNQNGLKRLLREARVLGLIARHCRFQVPVVIHQSPAGWQLRQPVPGAVDPFPIYGRVKTDAGLAKAIGTAMGRVLADQHCNVPVSELSGWLPSRPSWPPPKSEISRDLARVTDDADLIGQCLSLIDRYLDAESAVRERVLTHSDFGFHNLVFDDTRKAIVGAFDYDDAALTDRHYDFRYLLLDIENDALLDAAVTAYVAAGGRPIDRRRVALFNAASAIGFLAFRAGFGPDEKPAGRTLAEDLAWTRLALDRARRRE
jgi:aminoglycoside phosphotransferase (APT) family kinase protein